MPMPRSNAVSSPKLFDIALQVHICHMMLRVLGKSLCNLDPKVKVKVQKRVFARVYHRRQSSLLINFRLKGEL